MECTGHVNNIHIFKDSWIRNNRVSDPTYSRVTADHVTRHNFSSQGAILLEKFSCFIGELKDPKMKQNIAFHALKPFIPPVNCMQKTSHKTSQQYVTVKKVKANPRKKAKKNKREACPCPLLPAMRSSSDSPKPPSMHSSSPSIAVKCLSRQESSASGMKSMIKNQSALSTHTPPGDSEQCTCMEICIKRGNTKDHMKSCVERLKLSNAKESKKEILNSSSPMKKPKSHILDLWKKPYKSGPIQQNEQGEMLVPLANHVLQVQVTEKGQLHPQSALPKEANPVSPHLLLLLLQIFTKYGSHDQIW